MQCYADPNPQFTPAMRLISSITKACPTVITTSFDHGYLSGLLVRIKIPIACGMQQLGNYLGYITVTGATTFTLDVYSTSYDTFAIPTSPTPTIPIWSDICAQVLPVGELSGMQDEALKRST